MPASPKVRFLEQKPFVTSHQDVVLSAPFLAAADAALLQLISDLPDTTDPTMAAAAYHRILGARQYLRMLETVADSPKPLPPKRSLDNLNRNQ
jgi:hypothetical protein